MIGKVNMPDAVQKQIAQASEISGSAALNKLADKIYPNLPADNMELMQLLDLLVSSGSGRVFWLATQWIKRRKLYDLEYFAYYEKWLFGSIHRWGQCDVFCYRVLNPMVETHLHLFENVKSWTDSSRTYVRRAAPVSLLQSNQSFRVNCDIQKVLWIAEKLKHDTEIHVQKGVGWLLKYACLAYPSEVLDYLTSNAGSLPRVIFRYALEKAPDDIREKLMKR